MVDQKNRAMAVGMNGFISKPFTPNHLLSTIQEYLNSPVSDASNEQGSVKGIELNRACLNELYGDDKDYAADMFRTFLSEVVPDFNSLADLIKSNERESLAKAVHKLKPTLGMVGLTELEKRMFDFEDRIRQPSEIKELLDTWKNIFKDINQSLPIIRNELAKLQA